MRTRRSEPIAVLISDVHYSLNTFHIADIAFRMAIDKAAALSVPLIDCGDLTNDKALMRAEYVNALINTMLYAKSKGVKVYCLVGNHSLCNEKGEEHSLNFLRPYCTIVDTPGTVDGFNFVPYQNTSEKFMRAIQKFIEGSIVIGHQGTIGGYMGDYVKDTSAIDPPTVAAWVVYLGHYHRHYPLLSTVSVGNPYSLTYGEAGDGPKGFLILHAGGGCERVLTGLRKHVILEKAWDEPVPSIEGLNPQDLLWLKIKGPYSELEKLNKKDIGMKLLGHANFRFDKIPTETSRIKVERVKLTDEQLLDILIDETDENKTQRDYLKDLWRTIV